MKDKIYKLLPHFLQNSLISIFNKNAYKARNGGSYISYRNEKKNNRNLSLKDLKEYQKNRYKEFINYAIEHSDFYNSQLGDIENPADISNISKLPILKKETLRSQIKSIESKTNEKTETYKTGGTTGKSLEVTYLIKNTQERFGFLDDFRSRSGYELGKKTAWFSGKSLLTNRDLKKKRFWKFDFIHKVRYYSTFHIKDDYLKYYIEDLIKFQPEYFIGFPSTLLEIAKYGLAKGFNYPQGVTKAIFPTAETITAEMRETIESFFHTKMYNQYASSEGAPFIFECINGNLHLELQSGVFEVLDEKNQPAKSGRLILTSFTTEGTPLIRYDIEDSITLEDENVQCDCGNNNPLVKEILGRIDDYIYSSETGKMNLGNISNTLKNTHGIKNFQVVQDTIDTLDIYLATDNSEYNKEIEKTFISNWRDRVGSKMKLNIHQVDQIEVEKSGKFRMVKNNIKHLLND